MFDIVYTEEITSVEQACQSCRTRYLWVLNKHTDYSNFDFTWEPAPWEGTFRHAWPSQWQKDSGTYLVPKTGYTETKYHTAPAVVSLPGSENWINTDLDFDYSWHPDPGDPPYIYHFGTQHQKAGGPIYQVPGAVDVKYVDSPRYTKHSIDDCWVIPEDVTIENFDYTWHPDPTDPVYNYQFGTQHQKTGGPQYIVPGATETKYVTTISGTVKAVAKGIVVIDHAGLHSENFDLPVLVKTRYIGDYKGTLKRALSKLTDVDFVWVVSDICNYRDFDFSWHPEQWQNGMLHVFPSNRQKFGDTFFVHVPSFLEKIDDCEILEWYQTLNFVQDCSVTRFHASIEQYTSDSVVDAVWNHTFKFPYTVFYRGQSFVNPPTISLWREKTKTVVPLKKGGECVLVPREVKNHLKTQIYDYPWIDKTFVKIPAQPQDIVFISNGESNAERNWEHLCKSTQTIPNRVVRVDGVKGRAEAYRAAVEASNTDWAFCVFAKLKINPEFDWSWQPDRLQAPKHYIFHAQNPVNGLVYGHMAMIAYNKQLTLNTNPAGLDFTLDSEHEVVPLLSGVARYADDPWIAWRSAFRECIKLYHSLPDIENEYRLQQWLNNNLLGDTVGEWSKQGASDAIEYYDSVQGSFDALKLTYEWDWLANYLNQKHNLTPDQLCTQFQDQ